MQSNFVLLNIYQIHQMFFSVSLSLFLFLPQFEKNSNLVSPLYFRRPAICANGRFVKICHFSLYLSLFYYLQLFLRSSFFQEKCLSIKKCPYFRRHLVLIVKFNNVSKDFFFTTHVICLPPLKSKIKLVCLSVFMSVCFYVCLFLSLSVFMSVCTKISFHLPFLAPERTRNG